MMKKLISFLLSITLCSSMMTIFPAASWDLNEEQAVEGDISSYVQVEEVTFGEPEPIAEPLNEEELYQLEWVGDLFEAETETDEAQPMADLPDLSVRNLKIEAGDMTSPYPAGMAMYYTFQLLNYGTADAENAEVIVKLDGAVATNPVPMGTVPAGKGGNIQFRGPEMTQGTHTMEIVVNPDNKIVESNYNNNTTSSSFTYKACFELIALSMTSNKQIDESTVPTYEVGESVTFTMDFQNIGLLDAKNVPIALYGTFREPGQQPVTSQMGYTNYIEELPAKTRMQAEVKLTFTKEASARISFVLDPEKILGDMDYSNNTAEANLKISGGKDTKYALCIGVNRDEEPDSGYFSETVQKAHNSFKNIGLSSLFNGNPDLNFMLSTNIQSGRKQLASDVLFFYGHGNENCMSFRSNDNHTGIYKINSITANVHQGDDPTDKSVYAGMRMEDFQYVDIASFIGCLTGADVTVYPLSKEKTSIAEFAVNSGAQVSLGFYNEIHSRNQAGQEWIQNYIGKLCEGYTFQEAVEWASAYSPSDLSTCFRVFGDGNYQIVETAVMPYNEEQSSNLLRTPHQLTALLSKNQYIDEKASQHQEYQEIYDLIESVDPSFGAENYHLTTNFYSEDSDDAFIRLQYYIGDKIATSKMYNIIYRDGKVTSIVKLPLTMSYNDKNVEEEILLQRVEKYEQLPQTYEAELPYFGDNIIVAKQKQQYYYDYQTNELKDVHTYTLEFLDEGNTYDVYDEEIIIP